MNPIEILCNIFSITMNYITDVQNYEHNPVRSNPGHSEDVFFSLFMHSNSSKYPHSGQLQTALLTFILCHSSTLTALYTLR